MPADLAKRFVANVTLLNAKKRAPIFDVLGSPRSMFGGPVPSVAKRGRGGVKA